MQYNSYQYTQHLVGSISATCRTMTCEGANTECYDDHGAIPGVCQCQVGYINETEITTITNCNG